MVQRNTIISDNTSWENQRLTLTTRTTTALSLLSFGAAGRFHSTQPVDDDDLIQRLRSAPSFVKSLFYRIKNRKMFLYVQRSEELTLPTRGSRETVV
jgi:hypothetical protein